MDCFEHLIFIALIWQDFSISIGANVIPGDTQQSDPMMGNRTGSSDSNHEKDKDAVDAKKKEKVRFLPLYFYQLTISWQSAEN